MSGKRKLDHGVGDLAAERGVRNRVGGRGGGRGGRASAGDTAAAERPPPMESVLTLALSEKRIARVYMWAERQLPLVDIREIYMVEEQARPGRKGISLTAAQWRALAARAADITAAIEGLEAQAKAAKAARRAEAAAAGGAEEEEAEAGKDDDDADSGAM
jgi:hypothetical protein